MFVRSIDIVLIVPDVIFAWCKNSDIDNTSTAVPICTSRRHRNNSYLRYDDVKATRVRVSIFKKKIYIYVYNSFGSEKRTDFTA